MYFRVDWGVCPYEQGPLATRDDLIAYHFHPVEVRQLHAPALLSLSDNESHSLVGWLISLPPGVGWYIMDVN